MKRLTAWSLPALLLLMVVGCSKDDTNLTGPVANSQQEKVSQTTPKSEWPAWPNPEWAKMPPYVKTYPAPARKNELQKTTTPPIVTNGDFETADFSGWTTFVTYPGIIDRANSSAPHPEWAWFVDNTDPRGSNTAIYGSMLHTDPMAHSGTYGASAVENLGGIDHRLYQTVTLPVGGNLTISFWLRWKNRYSGTPKWFDGAQDIFVTLRNPVTDAVLDVVYSAAVEQPSPYSGGGSITSANYEQRSADITAFAGQTVRLDFTTNAHASLLYVDFDDIQIVLATALTVTPPPDVTVYTGSNATSCGTLVSDAELGTATTDPAGATITRSGVPSGNFFPVGQTTVTYTATDTHGHTAVGNQVVTVIDNTPPTVTAPPAVTAYTGPGATTCEAVVNDLGTPVASDNCPGVTVSRAPAGNAFPVGTTTVTYTATDAHGNTATATQMVTVVDNTPPTITVPPTLTVFTGPNATSCSALVNDATLGVSVSDNCSGVTLTRTPSGNTFPAGTTTVTYTATDQAGNVASATQTVTVVDNTPPVILSVSATPNAMWPPNHKMFTVAVSVNASDNCSGVVSQIVGVTSSEADNGVGDGNTVNDIQNVNGLSVDLRAERSGKGNGRIYTITVRSTDGSGNYSERTVDVTIADNKGKNH
jgi:hypothetical protein